MKVKIFVIFLTIVFTFVFASCSKINEEVFAPPKSQRITYKDDIKKILDENCVLCHKRTSADSLARRIDLSNYFNIVLSGVVSPGDPNSLLVRSTQPGGSMYQYVGSEVNSQKIKKWVVEDSLALGDIKIHPPDWVQISSPNSHGRFIRATGWNLTQCKQCHGADYQGGISKSSCYTCHDAPGGPEACNTCHGGPLNPAPPRDLSNNFSTNAPGVGAHQIHVDIFTCSECHITPKTLRDSTHINGKVEVIFAENSLARVSTSSGQIVPDPVYQKQDLSCSNVYCHGYFKNGNLENKPIWTNIRPSEQACGTCHSLPPGGSHPQLNISCESCHYTAVENTVVQITETKDNKIVIKDKQRHVNGKISLFGREQNF